MHAVALSAILNTVRVFKNKWFYRWAKNENIPDSVLHNAAIQIISGNVEADLGGHLFKKRIARSGGGKRGGYRTIVGYRKPNTERIIFLYAFAKNASADISDKEEAALSIAAEAFVLATDEEIKKLLTNGSIWEVHHE